MNRWGIDACREHSEEIVDWIAEKRGWWKYATMIPGSRIAIKTMVNAAISKADAYRASIR
jgi:hypothetical protein